MKHIITKLCLYGTLSIVYTSAFFFGALYPQFGIPEGAVVYQENEKTDEAAEKAVTSKDEAEVVYKSYFLEKIKSLKPEDRKNRWENRCESK